MWPRGRVDGQRAEYRRLGAGRRLLDRWVAPREGKARAQTICQGRWPAAREAQPATVQRTGRPVLDTTLECPVD